MSPKIRDEKITSFSPENLKDALRRQKMTLSDLSKKVHYSYRTLQRYMEKGSMNKDLVDPICDILDVSKIYILGETDIYVSRFIDFSDSEKKREALKQLLKYSNLPDYVDKVDNIEMFGITHLVFLLTTLIDDPEQFYKTVIGAIHEGEPVPQMQDEILIMLSEVDAKTQDFIYHLLKIKTEPK